MSSKVDVLWSPNHPDRFLTFSTELVLYSVEKSREATKALATRLSDDTHAYREAVNSNHQYLKCVSWCPRQTPDHLVALGQANGRVILTSFGKGGTADPQNLIGKEFSPKHARQCNQLAWNKLDTNLLGVVLEKSRNDCSVLVWDVNTRPVQFYNVTGVQASEAGIITKPLVEIGFGEVTSSLAWSTNEQRVLFAGMGNKYLRRYDIRDVTHHMGAASTKAVYGVCMDPHCEYRLASFIEDQVLMWDVRSFDRPVLTFRENRHILKIAWCPSRFRLLASLAKDSSVVKLYDVQHSGLGTDELEPAIMERLIHPYTSQQAVSSFSWHPTDENRMLTVTPTGNLRDIRIFERIALSWSPSTTLTWTCGRRFIDCRAKPTPDVQATTSATSPHAEDISAVMYRRALGKYGLATEDLGENADVSDSNEIKCAWQWLELVRKHSDEPRPRTMAASGTVPSSKTYSRIHGAKSIIRGELSALGLCSKSEVTYSHAGHDAGHDAGQLARMKQFRSEERTKILELCGWDFTRGDFALKAFLDRLEASKQHERAAAVSLFNLKMRQSIEILKRANDVALNVVAMALSGFADSGNVMWREQCSELRLQLGNAYLRAMFAFLTADGHGGGVGLNAAITATASAAAGSTGTSGATGTASHSAGTNPDGTGMNATPGGGIDYHYVLSEEGMPLKDRLAFACLYLNDHKLNTFLESSVEVLVQTGCLEGLLLTGMTRDGVDLLQSYVDRTGDVQTASLLVLHSFPGDITRDVRVQSWLDSYRELLDRWRLWHHRAEFDVHCYRYDNVNSPSPQVFVSCNFCGKSISYQKMHANRSRHFQFSRPGPTTNKSKVSSCPSCRKPLPRCALCLINMGTASGTSSQHQLQHGSTAVDNGMMTSFSEWFTWCQSCRHGGHADHISLWFREHMECPVSGCTCKCMLLDAASIHPVTDVTASTASSQQQLVPLS